MRPIVYISLTLKRKTNSDLTSFLQVLPLWADDDKNNNVAKTCRWTVLSFTSSSQVC